MRKGRFIASVVVVCAMLGCQGRAMGPEPKLEFPEGGAEDVRENPFFANLLLTNTIERFAVRRPKLSRSVDAQIAAMLDYVKKQRRGELDQRTLEATAAATEERSRREETERLSNAAARLSMFLNLESGATELSRVALSALAKELGHDAEYREAQGDEPLGGIDLSPEMRDGIGVLWVQHLTGDMSSRILGLLSQWAGSDSPPRAIVLDLSDCEIGSPDVAATIVNAFAPGATAFDLMLRDPKSGALSRRRWGGGESKSRALRLDDARLFVVTSSHTTSLAEAVTEALRHHRGARIVGSMTKGTGRLLHFHELPSDAWFGFTVADVIATDGQPLRGRPIVPDACQVEERIEPLRERTVATYRAQCGDDDREVRKEALYEYVRALLAAESRDKAGNGGGASKYGEEET